MFIQNLKTLALIEDEKFVTDTLLGEKEKWTNKGNDKKHILILFYTNFPIYYIGAKDEKRQNAKRRQILIKASWFSFPQYIWPLSSCIQNLKTLALIGAEISVTEIFIGEREKWTNKGNDKQEEADSLLHNTTSHTQHLYQNFKILSAVVPEKSLTKKKKKEVYTHTNTHTHTEKTKNYTGAFH